MAKPTGRGTYVIHRNGDGDITVQLANFDIDGWDLKKDHTDILKATVLEILKSGGSVAILGHASTTGDVSHDEVISANRAGEVIKFLRKEGGNTFFVNKLDYRGKATALALTGQDNTEDANWRTVWVRVWTNKNPPPDIGTKLINPDVPLPKDPFISTFSDDLGLASGVLSIVDLGVDIAGLALAGVITGVGGLALTVIGGLIALPALWATVDALAESNGKMQGYADAMQDMAAGFSDDALDSKPLKDWPAIPVPTPHILSSADTAPQQFWHQGQRWGCAQARIDVLKLQAEPVEVDAPLKKGGTRKMKVNGKVMLRSAWVSSKGEVGAAVMKVFNERLAAAGKKPFPTR